MDVLRNLATEIHKMGGSEDEYKKAVDFLNDLASATNSDATALAMILWESMASGLDLDGAKHQLRSGISTSSKHLQFGV